ncbi:MAG: DUF432 domain-containing protein [Thermoproteota archaeon]|jgi:hypothetical protein|nr:DUF432 domain-containing protein [Thermoproteota archaeon]
MELNYSITKEKDHLVYQKGEKKIEIPSNLTIKEFPILSINEAITEYFGIVFEQPIYIGEEQEVKLYVKLPLDIGIYVSDGSNYKLIDVIEIYTKKYALYGTIGEGVIYRYWKTNAFLVLPITSVNEAITLIEIINKAGSVGSISKIIFNTKFFSLYTKEGKFYGERIRVTRLQKGLALVRLMNKPTIEDAEIIPTTISKGIGGQFEMKFGT